TVAGPHIERELAMVKVRGKGDHRMEALRLADAFRARVIDASTESFVFQITRASDQIESFLALMSPLRLVDGSRPGMVAIARGPEGMCRRSSAPGLSRRVIDPRSSKAAANSWPEQG